MTKTIGDIACEVIVQNPGLKNKELLAKTLALAPADAKTSEACIAWYKSAMKKNPVKYAKYLGAKTEEVETSASIDAEIEELRSKIELLEIRKQELIKEEAGAKKAKLEEMRKMLLEMEAEVALEEEEEEEEA
jgi:hypothetical protein